MAVKYIFSTLLLYLFINGYSTNLHKISLTFSHATNQYLIITINPNPTSGVLKIKIYGLYSVRGLPSNLRIIGIKGEEIADLTAIFLQNNNGSWSEFSTRISFPTNGIYFLILRAGKYSVNEKFIVVK
jgi:hypothetical protein